MKKKQIYLIAAILSGLILSVLFYFTLRGTISIPAELVLGPFSLHFYSFAILGGIVLAAYLFNRYKKKHRELDKLNTDEALLFAVIPGVILARAWYVIIFWNIYQAEPLRMFQIWEGGLSIYGALLGGILGAYIYTRMRKVNFIKTLELAFIFVPLAQIMGRFGNFINQELYGPVTDLPWGMYVRATGQFHHPSFFYEQIGNLLVFAILFRYYRKHGIKGNGIMPALYLVCYGVVRFVIDIYRNDERVFAPFTIAQLVSIIMVAAGLVFLTVKRLKKSQTQK